MALSNILSKLNWRLMVIHFIACWFFIYAFQQLSVLHDPEFFKEVRNIRSSAVQRRIFYNAIWFSFSADAGLLTGFIISLVLSIKHKWYWLNSVIAFVLIALLKWFDLLGWDYLKHIFLKLGLLFKSNAEYFLANGLVMLVIGLCLFFMRWSIRFINGDKQSLSTSSIS
ncbi:hypothetical protein ACPPVU_21655 [Mucilaginibacter sp. McL0603]|uniref:hypothetical protein n=1 Tax=Mucilaginibacter sp. McL0603 TaxID=3415670 RepID=UPI003CF65E3B